MDSVLDADDVRYFGTDAAQGGDIQDMEGAVLATPNDTQLWLRLAYSKLSNPARYSHKHVCFVFHGEVYHSQLISVVFFSVCVCVSFCLLSKCLLQSLCLFTSTPSHLTTYTYGMKLCV